MTTELRRTLSQVQAQIHRSRVSIIPEDQSFLDQNDCVRSQLVEPILGALGWDSANSEEVKHDFLKEEQLGDSDIALFDSGSPYLLLVLRGLGEDIDEHRVLNELIPKAGNFGFEWVLLTDGDSYDVFNARAGLTPEQRAFDSIRLSVDSNEQVLELFGLLSKQLLEENRMAARWRCRQVDRQVRDSLHGLLVPGSPLVRLIVRETENLTEADVACSLSRMRVSIDFEYHGPEGATSEIEISHEQACSNSMSETELLVATWLQRRSIERWARGDPILVRERTSQRRATEQRRSCNDRRERARDRRISSVKRAEERRSMKERRLHERRSGGERRMIGDRRRAKKRA